MKILELGEYEWKINQFQSKNAKVDIEKIDYHMHTDIVKWFEYKTIKTKLSILFSYDRENLILCGYIFEDRYSVHTYEDIYN